MDNNICWLISFQEMSSDIDFCNQHISIRFFLRHRKETDVKSEDVTRELCAREQFWSVNKHRTYRENRALSVAGPSLWKCLFWHCACSPESVIISMLA